MTKLKRCPFCGGEAKLYEPIEGFHMWVVACNKCACGTNYDNDTKEEAIKAWNTRTPEIVRCGECGEYEAYDNYCKYGSTHTCSDWFCRYGERREEK